MEIALAIYALGYIVACIMVSAVITSFLIRDNTKVGFPALVISVMIISLMSWLTIFSISKYVKNKNNSKKDKQK